MMTSLQWKSITSDFFNKQNTAFFIAQFYIKSMAALTKAIGRSYVAASTYGSTIYTPTMVSRNFLLKS